MSLSGLLNYLDNEGLELMIAKQLRKKWLKCSDFAKGLLIIMAIEVVVIAVAMFLTLWIIFGAAIGGLAVALLLFALAISSLAKPKFTLYKGLDLIDDGEGTITIKLK